MLPLRASIDANVRKNGTRVLTSYSSKRSSLEIRNCGYWARDGTRDVMIRIALYWCYYLDLAPGLEQARHEECLPLLNKRTVIKETK